jgi:hypothetical protein
VFHSKTGLVECVLTQTLFCGFQGQIFIDKVKQPIFYRFIQTLRVILVMGF